jgi:ankyrin repeat protein
MMKLQKILVLSAALAAVAAPVVPAAAQMYSDGYTFLKAVKERDGEKATELIVSPGSTVINIREQGGAGDGALHILARDRDMTWLSFLLGKGAKPDLQNREGLTPLAITAQNGWVEGAERLLRSGAKVDLANSRGETPLIIAVQRRDIAMVRVLLGKGANPKRTDSIAGYSAIDYAKQDGRSAAILKLLEEEQAPKKAAAGPSL